jgi:acetylornithine deacetylase/succinyl-diaminopimelate desuccinylase-like protein
MTDLGDRVTALLPRAWTELAELVAIRSVAGAHSGLADECLRAGEWVASAFRAEGFADAHLAPTPDGSAAVVGTRPCADPDAPTVLLHAHYDVQPPSDEDAWRTPPFILTEVGGRWYGRGAADGKGNILVHLTALRALGEEVPVHLKLVVDGSEEQGTGGLEAFVPEHADLLRADAVLVCDTGNAAVGTPALTVGLPSMVNAVLTVEALESELHPGAFGGAAPDALAALVAMLASVRDGRGTTTVRDLPNDQVRSGARYPPERLRSDATPLHGVDLVGDGTIADMLWARPALTVLGIDCPPVPGSAAAIVPRARARLNLRIPPGVTPLQAQRALVAHLHEVAPWRVRIEIETEAAGEPFRARTDGPAHRAMLEAMREAYGSTPERLDQGGSIPLCNVLADTYPDAEILLVGVEEPRSHVHAPNESVHPGELRDMALVEALFLRRYGASARG